MSINGNRMPMAQARELADLISTALTVDGVLHLVCGSVRRGTKPDVGDLDIVVGDLEAANWALRKCGASVQMPKPRKGKEMRQATGWLQGIKIGLYFGKPDEWGAMILTYTGNFLLNIQMRAIAKRDGMKLNQYGLYLNGEVIAGKTEEQVFFALGLPFISPDQREMEHGQNLWDIRREHCRATSV